MRTIWRWLATRCTLLCLFRAGPGWTARAHPAPTKPTAHWLSRPRQLVRGGNCFYRARPQHDAICRSTVGIAAIFRPDRWSNLVTSHDGDRGHDRQWTWGVSLCWLRRGALRVSGAGWWPDQASQTCAETASTVTSRPVRMALVGLGGQIKQPDSANRRLAVYGFGARRSQIHGI